MFNSCAQDPQAFWAKAAKELALVQERGTRSSTGTSRSPSGSSAARSTSATTASTAIVNRAARTRPRSSGKASPATAACSRYQDLHREVCKFANVSEKLGVKTGDRVTIYMPMIPGAGDRHARLRAHRRAAQRRLRRLQRRSRCRPHQRRQGQVVITADGGWRRGKVVPLKQNVDDALAEIADRSRMSSSSIAAAGHRRRR